MADDAIGLASRLQLSQFLAEPQAGVSPFDFAVIAAPLEWLDFELAFPRVDKRAEVVLEGVG